MLLILSPQAHHDDIDQLIERLEWMGFRVSLYNEEGRLSLSVVDEEEKHVRYDLFVHLPFVEKVVPLPHPFKHAACEYKTKRLQIKIKETIIGGEELAIIAGPCSVESEEQIHQTAGLVAAAGANCLRGGAFKPRTSPYQFQGLGKEGLRYLYDAGRAYDLVTVSEIMDTDNLDLLMQYVDILQVGARNMQNYSLLKKLGTIRKPILLKRGPSATYKEWLLAAEYILNGGNEQVILCERGIRTFENYSRYTLDIAAVPILRELSHLPIIVDPSHGTGLRKMVTPMARAAIAAGADGIMVEVHPHPDSALSDAQQSLPPRQFETLMDSIRVISSAINRTIPSNKEKLSPLLTI